MALYAKEKPEYLKLAIQSIIEQTAKPDEIIIVIDGQINKKLQQVVDEFVDGYPKLFHVVGYKKNRGLGFALNYGIAYCRNELVARMDTDDISKPTRCEKQLKMFAYNNELVIVGTCIDEFKDDVNNIIASRVVPAGSREIYEFAKRRSAFNHPTVMYKKSVIEKFGGYANLRRNQDVELFGRMIYGGCQTANLQEKLLLFRNDDNLSKRRKSWENTWSYIATINNFRKMGYSSIGDLAIVFVAQMGMFFCPISLQGIIYKKFLRK